MTESMIAVDELLMLIESGFTPKQTNRIQLCRWLLAREGRLDNRLATRDLLRIRQIVPPRRREG